MKFAIYSRKSKFTGKGESIENQIEMCKDYICSKFQNVQDEDIYIYEDEGFSAKNLDRPQFQAMMSKANKSEFNYIVIYRLDRISRNVSDFSSLIETLNSLNISFICIKEQFDTSTPMGRAMMYIASVFSQLERETIAERVRDNMYMLARTGRWLGGTYALGFNSEKVESVDIDGKSRMTYKLKPVKDEMNLVKLIFEKFLEVQSLSGLEKYLLSNDIKSRKENYFTKKSLRNILTNPVYCEANKQSYDYLYNLGCQMCCDDSELDGSYAYISYNRTSGVGKSAQKRNDCDQWIIAVSKHKSIIKSEDWIKANNIIQNNKPLAERRKTHNPTALLSGLLVCGNCGHYMRPKINSHYKAKGLDVYDYMCEFKERSRSTKCNICNVDGNDLDNKVCEELFKFDISESAINKQLETIKKECSKISDVNIVELDIVNQKIDETSTAIQNLIMSLSKGLNENVVVYVNSQITKLDEQLQQYKLKKNEIELNTEYGNSVKAKYENVIDTLTELKNRIDTIPIPEKRNLLRKVISKIIWDGNKADIFIVGTL